MIRALLTVSALLMAGCSRDQVTLRVSGADPDQPVVGARVQMITATRLLTPDVTSGVTNENGTVELRPLKGEGCHLVIESANRRVDTMLVPLAELGLPRTFEYPGAPCPTDLRVVITWPKETK